MLYLRDNGPFRLKSFSSSTKGTKGVIRIEVECDDLRELGYELGHLAEIEAKQRAATQRVEAAKRTPKEKFLALPAPRKALPTPKRGD